MSSINGLGGNLPIQKIVSQPVHKSNPVAAASAAGSVDKVELSGGSAGQLSGVRMDKVAQVRAALEAGTYETPARLSIAVDRLLDDILK
jgi:anti-sigma28 factor (negative regulator of flagellin synthesis)